MKKQIVEAGVVLGFLATLASCSDNNNRYPGGPGGPIAGFGSNCAVPPGANIQGDQSDIDGTYRIERTYEPWESFLSSCTQSGTIELHSRTMIGRNDQAVIYGKLNVSPNFFFFSGMPTPSTAPTSPYCFSSINNGQVEFGGFESDGFDSSLYFLDVRGHSGPVQGAVNYQQTPGFPQTGAPGTWQFVVEFTRAPSAYYPLAPLWNSGGALSTPGHFVINSTGTSSFGEMRTLWWLE